MANPELQVSALSCQRGERWLWKDVQFELGRGQLLQITGGNGCGKTSLLKILAGLAKASSGSIIWRGDSIQRQRIPYLQQIHYLGHQTAVKNGLMVSENIQLNLKKKIQEVDFISVIEQVGLTAYNRHYGYQLSQGQKQRVALANLLLSDSILWILDEPFTALDQAMIDAVQSHFSRHLQNNGMIILTTHRPLTEPRLINHHLTLQAYE